MIIILHDIEDRSVYLLGKQLKFCWDSGRF